MTNPLSDLKTTVEQVRAEHFPDLPADLVAEVLQIEEECVESRPDAARRVETAIQNSLDRQGA